eukprot:136598-Karenia_brevis.AAC.1
MHLVSAVVSDRMTQTIPSHWKGGTRGALTCIYPWHLAALRASYTRCQEREFRASVSHWRTDLTPRTEAAGRQPTSGP